MIQSVNSTCYNETSIKLKRQDLKSFLVGKHIGVLGGWYTRRGRDQMGYSPGLSYSPPTSLVLSTPEKGSWSLVNGVLFNNSEVPALPSTGILNGSLEG